ncbi:hypothetical protein KBD59_03055 [Candidatus Gracilibacteria bacterium]|nr:hypothetical protein [Candidatus Gracilibacteria bacterium]
MAEKQEAWDGVERRKEQLPFAAVAGRVVDRVEAGKGSATREHGQKRDGLIAQAQVIAAGRVRNLTEGLGLTDESVAQAEKFLGSGETGTELNDEQYSFLVLLEGAFNRESDLSNGVEWKDVEAALRLRPYLLERLMKQGEQGTHLSVIGQTDEKILFGQAHENVDRAGWTVAVAAAEKAGMRVIGESEYNLIQAHRPIDQNTRRKGTVDPKCECWVVGEDGTMRSAHRAKDGKVVISAPVTPDSIYSTYKVRFALDVPKA